MIFQIVKAFWLFPALKLIQKLMDRDIPIIKLDHKSVQEIRNSVWGALRGCVTPNLRSVVVDIRDYEPSYNLK